MKAFLKMNQNNMKMTNIGMLTEDESKWEIWKERIENLLKRMKLWGKVNKERPSNDLEIKLWEEATEEAIAIMKTHVGDDLLHIIRK